ncbi:MFS-type transporter SLC18B1 isoform X2 [Tribolium castaneum]|nr:PREDICTED: MFS-type transporter SLC18B1-like isoform X2 [Tribolium castaneum]|eukprot:XP_015836088.1 PREDICTED: MFS-type transporter SLC18B1-like isoform X2 [Tribolium castaneum]
MLVTKQGLGLAIIAIIDLMSFCSINVLSLFLSKEMTQIGADLYIFELPVNFSALVTITSSLFLGLIIPKYRQRDLFVGAVVLSRTGSILFGVLYYYVTDETFFTCLAYILRGIEEAGACAYFISGYVLIFRSFCDHAGIIRGFLECAVEIGTTIGPPVGDLFFTFKESGLPFYFVGIFTIFLALVGRCVLDEVINTSKQYQSLTNFMQIPAIIVTSCVVLTVSLTTSALDPSLGEYLTNLLPFRKSDYVYLFIAAAFAFSTPAWNYLTEKLARFEWIMPLGLYLTGLAIILLELDLVCSDFDKYFKLINVCMLGVCMAMSLAPTFRCLTTAAFENGYENNVTTHSYVISTWTFMFSLGEILGPAVGILVYQKYDFWVVCWMIATLNILVGFLCTLFFYCKRNKRNICCKFNVTIHFK